MLFLDIDTIQSLSLTCKSIDTDYSFWKRKYLKDKVPLFCVKTRLIDWIRDYKKMTFVKALTYDLIKTLPAHKIVIRYNYHEMRYHYHQYGDDIHHLLMSLLPPTIQQQINNGNGRYWQELVIFYQNGFKIIYHENYYIKNDNIVCDLASIYKLFIYMFYYCPEVNIYLYKNKLDKLVTWY